MKRIRLLFVITLAASGAAQTTLWTVPLEGPAHSPTLYPDEKSPAAVAIAAGATLALIDGRGQILWSAREGASFAAPATVADINADGAPEVVSALADGVVVCYNNTGQALWRTPSCAPSTGGYKNLVAADLMPSPGLEILAGFDNGWLYCLGAGGDVLWRFFGDKFRVGGIGVADADADGAPEIFYGTDNGHIYCLDGHGRMQWRYFELAPYGRSGPNIADLDGDGKPELLITRSNVGSATCLMALDAATGRFLWRTADYMQGYVSNSVVDLEGDGKLEIIHADKGNFVYCDNHDGSRRWQIELAGGGVFWAPAIADIDGDGHLEVLAGCRYTAPDTRNCFYVISDEGVLEQALAIGGGSNAGPVVADLDADGKLEVVLISNGPDQISARTWGGAGRVAWPSLRGDSRMSGATGVAAGAPSVFVPAPDVNADTIGQAGQTAETFLGANSWALAWNEPAPEEACIEVRVQPESGPAETTVVNLKSAEVSAVVPFQIARPGLSTVTVAMHTAVLGEQGDAGEQGETTHDCRVASQGDAGEQGDTTHDCRVASQGEVGEQGDTTHNCRVASQGGPIFVWTRSVTPLDAEFCDYEAVAAAVDKAVVAGPASSAATSLRRQLKLLEAERQDVGDADAATPLRARARTLQGRAELLEEWWGQGKPGSFVCWHDRNPWDPFDPAALPARIEMPAVSITAYGNEFEDAALTLLNVTDETIDVRCAWNAPVSGQGRPKPDPEVAGRIAFRRLIPVASAFSEQVFDPLPEIDLSRTITLPPGEARQVWLVVDTHGLAPGSYDLTLYLASLAKPPTVQPVLLKIEVWPVALPCDVFKKINWSTFDPAVASDQSVQDMIDHGVNVIYGPTLPPIPVDENGNRTGEADWSAFDSTLRRVPPHFTLLWSSPPGCMWPEGISPAPDSETHFNGFRTGVRELAAHLRDRGFPYGQWAFYPIDEPWNTGATHVAQLKAFAQMVKRADPEVLVYTDPAGGVRAQYLDEFKDLIDIWQPEINHLKRDPELRAWFTQNARRFWAYEATGPAKDLLPLGYYRAYAWLAWHLGLEGAGYWVYKGEDIWWPLGDGEYSAVYQTGTSVVPSRRWEADRDGVEDYRALDLLRQEINAAREDGRAEDADRAQALTDEAVHNLAGWQIGVIDEITRQTRDYEMDFNLLVNYREAIAREIMRLREARK